MRLILTSSPPASFSSLSKLCNEVRQLRRRGRRLISLQSKSHRHLINLCLTICLSDCLSLSLSPCPAYIAVRVFVVILFVPVSMYACIRRLRVCTSSLVRIRARQRIYLCSSVRTVCSVCMSCLVCLPACLSSSCFCLTK